MTEETISKEYAVQQVRQMAFSFAELYYTFVKDLRDEFGDEEATRIAQKVLFDRAFERAEDMIRRDYEMSFLSYSGSADKTPVETMLSSNFDPTVKYLKTLSGKTFKDNVSSFLRSIGITDAELDAIRSIMLE